MCAAISVYDHSVRSVIFAYLLGRQRVEGSVNGGRTEGGRRADGGQAVTLPEGAAGWSAASSVRSTTGEEGGAGLSITCYAKPTWW
jgi:hypothetical protein